MMLIESILQQVRDRQGDANDGERHLCWSPDYGDGLDKVSLGETAELLLSSSDRRINQRRIAT
jgi:hypothetical protein